MGRSEIGVVHGRFQPLHLGHMEYLLEAKKRCNLLIVGITNPDPSLTSEHSANPSRSLESSNPLSYYERLSIIRESLLEAELDRSEFEVVPFPINKPDCIQSYVPMDAQFFTTIYDEWGEIKVKMLRSLGLDVSVLWQRTMSERLTTGTEIRTLIASGGNWEKLVPRAAQRVIKQQKLDIKIQRLLKRGDDLDV